MRKLCKNTNIIVEIQTAVIITNSLWAVMLCWCKLGGGNPGRHPRMSAVELSIRNIWGRNPGDVRGNVRKKCPNGMPQSPRRVTSLVWRLFCATLVNTRTHTEMDNFWPVILLSQPGALKPGMGYYAGCYVTVFEKAVLKQKLNWIEEQTELHC